jgi:hypothetical protein
MTLAAGPVAAAQTRPTGAQRHGTHPPRSARSWRRARIGQNGDLH